MNRTTTNPSRPVRRPGRLTLAALLCGLVATTLSAAEPTGALAGRVTDTRTRRGRPP